MSAMNLKPGNKKLACSEQLTEDLPSASEVPAPPSTGYGSYLVEDHKSIWTADWAKADTKSGDHNVLPSCFRPPPGLPPPDLPTLLPARLPQLSGNVGLQNKLLKLPSLTERKKLNGVAMNAEGHVTSPQLTPPTLSPATSPSCFTPPPGLSLDEEGAMTMDDTSASDCSAVDAFDIEPTSRVSGTQLENAEAVGPQGGQVFLKLSDFFEDQPHNCGKQGCPSLGSINHHLGLCRPCDFVHRDGCRQGIDCPFCHLCGPEQNKQKKKERQKLMKNTKRWYAAMAGQLNGNSLHPLTFRF